jgi:hypothetical protein
VEPLVTKPREIQQNRRREAASIKVRRQAFGQGLLDRVGMSPELEGYDDVSKEPLEQQALEDAPPRSRSACDRREKAPVLRGGP